MIESEGYGERVRGDEVVDRGNVMGNGEMMGSKRWLEVR